MKNILIFLIIVLIAYCKKDCGYSQKIICTDYACKNCYCVMEAFNEKDYNITKFCGDSQRPICYDEYDKKEFSLICYPPKDPDN